MGSKVRESGEWLGTAAILGKPTAQGRAASVCPPLEPLDPAACPLTSQQALLVAGLRERK